MKSVPTLRLMSYNVRSMRDDRAALGRVIRSVAPDVVAVQESPRFLRWRSLCGQLARRAGLVVVSGGRPAGSNLILSSLAVEVEKAQNVLFTKDFRLHQRGTAIAVLRKQGARFAVAGIHLDLVAGPRYRHVGELEQAIAEAVPDGVPTVVAGDVNDAPGSAAWRLLTDARPDAAATAGVGDLNTYSAADPHKVVDGIFVDRRIRLLRTWAVDHPDVALASDHRPLVAELELP